ncbi:hypothetical protein KR018_005853, partial [Drosophila ironensis]
RMLWFLLACPLALGYGVLAGLMPPEPMRLAPLAGAALKILEEQVSPSQITLAVMELVWENDGRDHEQEELMTSILSLLGDTMALRTFKKPPADVPSQYVVFLVNSAEAFGSLSLNFTASHTTREYNFLILLTRRMTSREDRIQVLSDISDICVSLRTLNVILLMQKSNGVVLTYGYRLYNQNCEHNSVGLELIDRYKKGSFRFSHRERTFDRALRSLGGCPVNVSWYPLEPFVIFNGNASDPEELSQTWRLSGIDGELIKLLANIFDFKIQLEEPCNKCLSKDIKDGCSGCFDQIINESSSILIGAMSGSHQHREYFSTTTAYHQSSYVFIVNMQAQWGAVAQLAVPFCSSVWLALVLSVVLVILVIYFRRRILRTNEANLAVQFLQVLATTLGNPVVFGELPRHSQSRVLYATWLLLLLVLRVVYLGKLYDSFRQPFSRALPGDIAELMADNYTLVTQEYLDFYPRNMSVLTRNGSRDRFGFIQEVGEDERVATTSLIATLSYYNLMNRGTSHLTHVREHIFLYQLVIYLRRHWLLKFAFDRKIKQLLSSGIVGYIIREFDSSLYRVPFLEQHEVSALPLEIFCGLYYVSSILLSAAVLAFVLELLSIRIPWLRRYLE